MREIRTGIDKVFDFIQERGKTTKKEILRELYVDADELDKYLVVLQENHLIAVRYALTDTYLSIGEEAIATSY